MCAKNSTLLAFMGGTFDPIHYGHLRPVEALAEQLHISRITLLPNNVPPHRPQPMASATQRLAMVQLAVADNALFSVDPRELQRNKPSYTIDTLTELRDEYGAEQPLAFIIGQDSLLSLTTWHRWHELLDKCHLLVCARPGYQQQMQTSKQQVWLQQHQTHEISALQQQPSGLIYLASTPLIPISATAIRQCHQHHLRHNDWLPPAVSDYIAQHGLYR